MGDGGVNSIVEFIVLCCCYCSISPTLLLPSPAQLHFSFNRSLLQYVRQLQIIINNLFKLQMPFNYIEKYT